MARSVIDIQAPVDSVFDALLDPHTYPDWLVGAQDIRDVDDTWPAVGSRFHHRVGLGGPLKVADTTKILAINAPTLLQLEVRARPLGRGRVTFRLTGRDRNGTQLCRLEIDEVPIGLLAALRPLLDPLTKARNDRSLQRLAELVTSHVQES